MSDGPEPQPVKVPGSAHVSASLLIFFDPHLLHQRHILKTHLRDKAFQSIYSTEGDESGSVTNIEQCH